MEQLLESTEVQAAITSLIALLLAGAVRMVAPVIRECWHDRNWGKMQSLKQCIAAAVEQVYQQHVRPYKEGAKKTAAENDHDPLPPTMVVKARWNALAVANAEKIARDNGLDIKAILGAAAKAILPVLVSSAVKAAKGGR